MYQDIFIELKTMCFCLYFKEMCKCKHINAQTV